MEYTAAPKEITELVTSIANEHHAHLDGVRIAVIMQDHAGKSRGKTVRATASKPSGKIKPLLKGDFHFVICIAEMEWYDLTIDQRTALVDHELCHCSYDDEGEATLVGHDYEEFACIVQRHGMWRGDYGEKKIQGALLRQGITIGTIEHPPEQEQE